MFKTFSVVALALLILTSCSGEKESRKQGAKIAFCEVVQSPPDLSKLKAVISTSDGRLVGVCPIERGDKFARAYVFVPQSGCGKLAAFRPSAISIDRIGEKLRECSPQYSTDLVSRRNPKNTFVWIVDREDLSEADIEYIARYRRAIANQILMNGLDIYYMQGIGKFTCFETPKYFSSMRGVVSPRMLVDKYPVREILYSGESCEEVMGRVYGVDLPIVK